MKLSQLSIALFASFIILACNTKNQEKMKTDKKKLIEIFPKGEKGSKDLFTGNAYNTGLVNADTVLTTELLAMSISNLVQGAIGTVIPQVKF